MLLLQTSHTCNDGTLQQRLPLPNTTTHTAAHSPGTPYKRPSPVIAANELGRLPEIEVMATALKAPTTQCAAHTTMLLLQTSHACNDGTRQQRLYTSLLDPIQENIPDMPHIICSAVSVESEAGSVPRSSESNLSAQLLSGCAHATTPLT